MGFNSGFKGLNTRLVDEETIFAGTTVLVLILMEA